MDREELASVGKPDAPLLPTFPVLLTGLGLTAAAWLLGAALGESAPVLRAALIALGVTATAAGVAAQLPHASQALEGRLGAAGLWLLLTAELTLARYALDPAWDSIALLARFAIVATVLAAVVTALPRPWRRLALSLLILFHFAGIGVAVVNVPPPGGNVPWLASQLWTRVYRPYLTVTNLNNGYHFYAPEPGPCALVWFRVEFADGATRWVRIPDHKAVRSHLERRRYGSLATALGQPAPTPEKALRELTERRMEAGWGHNPPIPPGDMPMQMQYREPMLQGKMLLSSYARFITRTTAHPEGKDVPAVKVKIYHVEYHNPPVEHFHAGRPPLDPTLYSPFYEGEYDTQGNLTPACFRLRLDAQGREVERWQDPFLYWLIPILRRTDDRPAVQQDPTVPKVEPRGPERWSDEGRVVNFVRIHAGDKDEEAVP
jgi:hypothetical protein